MTTMKDLERRVEALEKLVLPESNKKVSTRKDLQKAHMSDLQPWLDQKRKEGKIFTIKVCTELYNCKDHFLGKKRTITTAYTWLNNAQKYADEKNPPKPKQPTMDLYEEFVENIND